MISIRDNLNPAQLTCGPKVLVVDSAPWYPEAIGALLQEQGYEVALARTGEAVIELARELWPEAVVADWLLGDMSTWDLRDQLRKRGLYPEIVVMSEERVFAGSGGASQPTFVPKPVHIDVLLAALRGLLPAQPAEHDCLPPAQRPAGDMVAIVGRDQSRLRLTQRLLELAGIRTGTHALPAGADAAFVLDELRQAHVCVVVADIPAPYVEQWEFLQQLRRLSVGTKLRFVPTTPHHAELVQAVGPARAHELRPYAPHLVRLGLAVGDALAGRR